MHERCYNQRIKFWLLAPYVVLSCTITTVPGAHADTFYGHRIVAPAASGSELKAAVADAVQTLQKMTGRDFTVAPEHTGSGIWLLHTDSAEAPADVKKPLLT